MWRFKADIQRTEATKKWWPFGEAMRYGFVRGMPVGILAGTALTVSIALVLVEESTSGGTSQPAAARHEPGAIALWWRSRKHRPLSAEGGDVIGNRVEAKATSASARSHSWPYRSRSLATVAYASNRCSCSRVTANLL
jgi:hypothetical protein